MSRVSGLLYSTRTVHNERVQRQEVPALRKSTSVSFYVSEKHSGLLTKVICKHVHMYVAGVAILTDDVGTMPNRGMSGRWKRQPSVAWEM